MDNNSDELTPLRAIEILRAKAKRVVLGRNLYLQITAVIRNLLKDRQEAYKKIEKLEAEIVKLQTPTPPKPRVPFHVEGTGSWE